MPMIALCVFIEPSGTLTISGPPSGRVTPRSRRSTTVTEANIMNVTDYDPVTGLEVFRYSEKNDINKLW